MDLRPPGREIPLALELLLIRLPFTSLYSSHSLISLRTSSRDLVRPRAQVQAGTVGLPAAIPAEPELLVLRCLEGLA
jgi:hypothetical protein